MQSQFFNSNGFRNTQFSNPCHLPPPNSIPYPEIVGEGNVTSIVLPDGTVQYFFIPSVKWWSPYLQPNVDLNYTYYGKPIVGAWLIKTISNPIPMYPYSPYYGCEEPAPCINTCANVLNTPKPKVFQLKFHNDKWTSTTDIHYFYPCLRQCDYSLRTAPIGCAAVQPDCCHDPHKQMSTTSLNCTNSKDKCLCGKESCRRTKRRKQATNANVDSCECQCGCRDKSVTTYADTACGMMQVDGQETQTCCTNQEPTRPETNSCCQITSPIVCTDRSIGTCSPCISQTGSSRCKSPSKRKSKRTSRYRDSSDCSSTCSFCSDLV